MDPLATKLEICISSDWNQIPADQTTDVRNVEEENMLVVRYKKGYKKEIRSVAKLLRGISNIFGIIYMTSHPVSSLQICLIKSSLVS